MCYPSPSSSELADRATTRPLKRAKSPPEAHAAASQTRSGRTPPRGSRGGVGIPASGNTVIAEKKRKPIAKNAGTTTFSLATAASRLLAAVSDIGSTA